SVLAVFISKEPRPNRRPAGNGVSTYLALIFGTLLSSQGTDASFVLTQVISWAFLRALPFGVPNSISVFPAP
ncbi:MULTISPECIES: hypothetical protein, partial [unclassified Streptomyces]|uniref:hypothetical protein n=1 Tax=unclassified Streptomyces TaxID=2593676 RepID=UPI002E792248